MLRIPTTGRAKCLPMLGSLKTFRKDLKWGFSADRFYVIRKGEVCQTRRKKTRGGAQFMVMLVV